MEVQHGSLIAALQRLHVISCAEESQCHAIRTQRRFNDVGQIVLVGLVIEVGHILTGNLLVTGQIVVGTIRNAPELAPAEGEEELQIRCGLGIERQLLLLMVSCPQHLLRNAQIQQPVLTELLPVSEPLQIGIRLAEELQLHLLELSGTEGEVARCDLVTEGLSDLTDSEGQLLPGGSLHILEVNKDALGCLGAQVNRILGILGDTLEGLEHQVELTNAGEVMLAAVRAGHLVILDELLHLLMRPGIHRAVQLQCILCREVLNKLVGTETGMALLTIHQGIREGGQMSGGDPGLGIHQNCAVDADIILRFLNELLPPGLLHIVLQLYAQISVIPGVGQTAVDLRARIYEASGLCQRNDSVHSVVFSHCIILFIM